MRKEYKIAFIHINICFWIIFISIFRFLQIKDIQKDVKIYGLYEKIC
jgi:hypothetical protein